MEAGGVNKQQMKKSKRMEANDVVQNESTASSGSDRSAYDKI